MRNGIYTAAAKAEQVPTMIFVVCDNLIQEYNIGWYGDLGMWEIREKNQEVSDAIAYSDDEYAEMLSDFLNVGWNEIYIERYDSDFDYLPHTQEEMNELLKWWEDTFNQE